MGRKLRGQEKSRSVGKPRRKEDRGRPGDLVWRVGRGLRFFSSSVVTPFVKEEEAVEQIYFSSLGFGALKGKMEIIGISFLIGRIGKFSEVICAKC